MGLEMFKATLGELLNATLLENKTRTAPRMGAHSGP